MQILILCNWTDAAADADGMRCFKMTESSGDLILVSALDRERTDRYQLTVTASDRGQPSLTTTTTVSSFLDSYTHFALVGCVAQLAERRSLAGELFLSCAWPAADG